MNRKYPSNLFFHGVTQTLENGVLLLQVGLKYNESMVIRVTGCPNGYAMPYMAELGLVGDEPNMYQVFHILVLVKTLETNVS